LTFYTKTFDRFIFLRYSEFTVKSDNFLYVTCIRRLHLEYPLYNFINIIGGRKMMCVIVCVALFACPHYNEVYSPCRQYIYKKVKN